MYDIVIAGLANFASTTHILNAATPYFNIAASLLCAFALFVCFLGFYVFRAGASAMVFVANIYFFCYIFNGTKNFGFTTASFTVVGIALAFVVFRSKKTGSMIFCAFASYFTVYCAFSNITAAVIIAIVSAIAVAVFPLLFTISITSVTGAYIFILLLCTWLPELNKANGFIFIPIILLSATGIIFQIIFTRKIHVFDKTMPYMISHYFERKKSNG